MVLSELLIKSTPAFIMRVSSQGNEREREREGSALSDDMLESSAHVGRSRRDSGVVLIAFFSSRSQTKTKIPIPFSFLIITKCSEL